MSSAYTDGCGNGTFAYKAQGSGGQHSVTKSSHLILDLRHFDNTNSILHIILWASLCLMTLYGEAVKYYPSKDT